MDSFGETAVFSTRHATSGYFQIEIYEQEQYNKTLDSHKALYRFTRMSYRLKYVLVALRKAMYVMFFRALITCSGLSTIYLRLPKTSC